MNAWRQVITLKTRKTSGGVKAPPHRAASHMIPWARTRSGRGSQVVNARVRLGKHPASPAPNRAWVQNSDAKFHVRPVSAVNEDHQMTIRIKTRRGPIQSPR